MESVESMQKYWVSFRIHPSGWFTVLFCMVIGFEMGGSSRFFLIGILLLASLLLHEVGHMLVARTLGVPVHEFGLRLAGAYNRRSYATRRRDEILISAAGPGMNFLAAMLLLAIPQIGAQLFICNMLLCIGNLIPLPSSDGLRILRMIRHTGTPAEISLAAAGAR